MLVLVTGGGGFLGRALIERLASLGHKVRLFSRGAYPEIEAFGVEAFQGDIRNRELIDFAVRGPVDAVFHVAAQPGIWGDIEEYRSINVHGTRSVIEACHQVGVRKLIYTSSPSVVFDMKDECGVDESVHYPDTFYNPYSETKAEAEQMVLRNNGVKDLLTCAIRPHLIWGPRDRHLLPRLIERAKAGKLRIVGSGHNKVDLTYIENAVHAHVQAFEHMTEERVSGNAYFVSDGAPVVLWDWINTFLTQMGIPPVTKKIPAPVAYVAGWAYEAYYKHKKILEEPPMTRFLARALSCSHYYNISNARRDLEYEPRVKNDDGLARTVLYFKRKQMDGGQRTAFILRKPGT